MTASPPSRVPKQREPVRGSAVPADAQAIAPATAAAPADPRAVRAAINPLRLAGLLAQLLALLWIFQEFSVADPGFVRLGVCATVGFVIHYFTPFQFKKQAFILISLVGGVIVMTPPEEQTYSFLVVTSVAALTVGVVVVMGLAFYLIMRLPIAFWWRVAIIVAIGALFAYWRSILWLPEPVIQVIAAIFMFRMILYCYEVKIARQPEKLIDFASYFFILPNFFFPLFPVIDYSTMKRSFYAVDIHKAAQRGIAWIARGTLHLCLYRVIYHNVLIGPDDVNSFWTLCRYIMPHIWIYLEVGGTFHIIVGILHLFGWSLPETNRKYFLASSYPDFWRRNNIYWKDFMVKAVYYPAYFRLRKKHELVALAVATLIVFAVTTVLHSYQAFWLQGDASITSADVVFWGGLGLLVMFTLIYQELRGPAPKRSTAVRVIQRVLSTAAVFLTISVLWSIWSSRSLGDWIDVVTYWS
jgi:hypothetical protein